MVGAVLPNPSARAEWLFAGIIDEPCVTGDKSSLLTVDPATTTSLTPRLTQKHQTMMTSSLSPAVRSSLCSHQVSNRWVLPIRCGLFLAGDGFSG